MYSLKIGSWKFAKASVGTSVVMTVALFIAAQLEAFNVPIGQQTVLVIVTSVANGLLRFVTNWLKVQGVVEM